LAVEHVEDLLFLIDEEAEDGQEGKVNVNF
jgi:hypothetical protein